MNKNIIFIYSLILYIFGIFINNLTGDLKTSLLVLLFLVVLFLGFIVLNNKYYLIIIALIPFILGVLISENNINFQNTNINFIEKYKNEKQNFVFEIGDIRKKDDQSITYNSRLISINNINLENKINNEVIINSKDEIEKGTIIETKSKLYLYKNTDDFKYKDYMLSNGLYFKIYPYNYSIQGINELNILEAKIIRIKDILLNTINRIYTKDEGIFLGGILLGARENLPAELKQNFNNSGLTHFIAVSGFNITILIIFVSYFIKFLPNFLKVIIMSIFILLFTLLVGFTAPVVRASIAGIIGYIIVTSGRKNNNLSIILFTLAIMTTYSPYSLNYDISLHLSFLAVLGILYSQSFFEKIFSFLPNILEIRTAFTLTLSALCFTLPIMVFNFGQLSLIAPISNILVSWTIPFAMLFGFVSIIGYFMSPIIGIIIGYFTWVLLKWDILIVNLLGGSQYSVIKYKFGEYSGYFEIIYLIILLFLVLYFRQEKKTS